MRLLHFKNAAVNVVRDMEQNHTMAFVAARAYYFLNTAYDVSETRRYFQDFPAYSKGYDSLGLALAFGISLYRTSLVVLIDAQLNAGLLQEAGGRAVPGVKRYAEPNLAA